MFGFVSKYRQYIAGLLLFYFNTDVIFWSGNLGLEPVLYLVQVICCLFFLKLDNWCYCNKYLFFLLMFVSFLVSVVHFFGSATYFYKFFVFFLVYIILKKTKIDELQIAYYKVVFIFSLVSIIMYVASNYMGLNVLMPVVFEGGAGETYATNFLYAHLANWTIRNGGVFREPGVFQIYLNIALLFYYQINRNKIIDKYSGVFLVAIFTTMSSAGIMIALCILFYQVIQQKNRSMTTTVVFIAFAIIGYYAIMASFDTIFYKLQLGKDDSMSTFARYYSVFIPLKIWLDYPIFGCGNAEFNELILQYPAENGLRLNPYLVTNSLTVIFATSGFFLGALCLYGVCKGAMRLCNNYKFPMLVIAIFLTMFSCEGQIYTIIFNYILMVGLCFTEPTFADGK